MGVSSSKIRKSRGGLCKRRAEKPIVYERVIRESNNESSVGVGLVITPTTYERDMMSFAFEKAEWKQERMKLKEEVRALRESVDEKDKMIRDLRDEKSENERNRINGVVESVDDDSKKGLTTKWGFLSAHELVLIEQIREERAMRDETIQKWKQLYLAIKMELDDLIQRTHEGGLYWRAEEEDMAEELKKDIKAKEATIKELRSKLCSMEQEIFKKDRESDIFKQSLRIISSSKYPPKKVVAKTRWS